MEVIHRRLSDIQRIEEKISMSNGKRCLTETGSTINIQFMKKINFYKKMNQNVREKEVLKSRKAEV